MNYSYIMDIEKLILFQKTYDFLLWLYNLIQHLPKRHKPVLGRYLEESGLSLLLLTINANKAVGRKRQALQQEISDELDRLRILLRLTKDLRFMSIKQYTYVAEKLNELGKILFGWKNVRTTTVKNKDVENKRVAKTNDNLPLF